MPSIHDAEGRAGQGSSKIKEEYGYQQWDMVASPGLNCTFISPTFLCKLCIVHNLNILEWVCHIKWNWENIIFFVGNLGIYIFWTN